jgi:hypothetical protein
LTGFELEQKKYVDALQKQYAATTDPQQRKILERQLYALGLKQPPKVQIATERDVNADGYPVTKNYIIDETGNTRPMVGGQDPTSMFADRPADAKDYIVGKIYKNKDGGAAIWTGEGFLTVNY